MSEKTVTRADLSESVYRELGLSRTESAELVEDIMEYISQALIRGEKVKISSFGAFSVRSKSERMGRNPKTGEEATIEPRRVITFKPSHILKDHVNDSLTAPRQED